MKNYHVIGLDPGFHSLKVSSGGATFQVPFAAQRVQEKSLINIESNSKGHIWLRNELTGELWLIGQEALKNDPSVRTVDERSRYTANRFKTRENMAVMLAGIALGMSTAQAGKDPYVAVALPHTHAKEVGGHLFTEGVLLGTHVVSLKVEGEPFVRYTIKLDKHSLIGISQSVAAFLSLVLSKDGKRLASPLWDEHVMIVDGGFYTLGLLSLEKRIDTDLGFSNTDLSMINAYKLAADKISEMTGRSIRFWELDTIISEYGGIVEYGHTAPFKELQIKPILDDAIAHFARETVDYIVSQYDIHKIRKFIIAGGTGMLYYPFFKERLGDKKVVLAKTKDFEPVLAIAVGTEKFGHYSLRQRSAQQAEAAATRQAE